jgi:NTP pyrophosphatase (non-canonical NTP hydrolase)
MDNTATISDLKKKIQKFCEERDWDQFHNPKDLAIGISTEANELLDIFRFKSNEQMTEMFNNEISKTHIKEEIADVLFFVLRFAQMNSLDLEDCIEEKLQKNSQKYSVEKSKGKNLKYTEM